jgi:hypothetical protein
MKTAGIASSIPENEGYSSTGYGRGSSIKKRDIILNGPAVYPRG